MKTSTCLPMTRREALWMGAFLPLAIQANQAMANGTRTLNAMSRILEVKGRAAKVFGLINEQGKAGLTLQYGEGFDVQLANQLPEETIIHWHGQTPPHAMDGVASLSGPTLKTGEMRRYQFELAKTGTHWMHSHLGLQEQKLLAAPLIVKETAEPLFDELEHVVLIHDFTFREPADILEELRKGGGAHAAHTMAGMDHSKMDHSTMSSMPGMAAVDVAYDAILANDRTLDDPEVVSVESPGRVRLRIINGSAATNMWIDLGSLQGDLIAVDGNAVSPIKGSIFPLAIAQRADIRLELPAGAGAYPVLFQSEGAALRGGIVLKSGNAPVAKISDQGQPGAAHDLTFESSLAAIAEFPDEPVTRTEMVMLTGGGADYVWGLNGKPAMHDVLFRVREGERIDVMLHNMTGMPHPMHLHGHYFKVVAINGQPVNGAIRDTILVPPNESVSIRFDANNPGNWAFHCHHLYHMNAGMLGAIAYSGAA